MANTVTPVHRRQISNDLFFQRQINLVEFLYHSTSSFVRNTPTLFFQKKEKIISSDLVHLIKILCYHIGSKKFWKRKMCSSFGIIFLHFLALMLVISIGPQSSILVNAFKAEKCFAFMFFFLITLNSAINKCIPEIICWCNLH